MKRVMMLLSNPFRPDPRVHKEARSLVAAGYGVKILCWDREQDHAKDEKVDGISITRLGPASAFARPLRFIITLPSFWLKAFRAGMKEDWQILHSHDLDTLPVGILMAKLKRRPLVYDSHEIYSSMVGEVTKGIAFKLTRWLERKLVKMPDAVICVNDRFRSILERWGARRVTVVMGCPPTPTASTEEVASIRKGLSPDGKAIVLYIGVLEPNRNLLELAEGFAGSGSEGARLVLGGFGSLEAKLRQHEGDRLTFLGEVKPSDVPALTLASDILVAVYDPSYANNRDSVPNKLFEAMSARKPIIVANETWTGKMVKDIGCGLVVRYGSSEVFEAIDRLLSDTTLYETCGQNGLDAHRREYNWPSMEKRLIFLYDAVAED